MADWINSLGGTPALAPPVITPASGIFTNKVTLTLSPTNVGATLYYTLDGSLPTTNSIVYNGPFELFSSATVTANAFETNYVNSVAVSGVFTIVPPVGQPLRTGVSGGWLVSNGILGATGADLRAANEHRPDKLGAL